MLCMLPALEDQNSDLLKNVDAILSETEKIVGTNKFFGEIWKAMLRTPRCRLSAIKYLDRKIPKDISLAVKAAKETRIYPSPYNLVIKSGEVFLESLPKDDSAPYPDWYQREVDFLNALED